MQKEQRHAIAKYKHMIHRYNY